MRLAWGAALAGTMAANLFYLTMQFYYFYVLAIFALALPVVAVRDDDRRSAATPRSSAAASARGPRSRESAAAPIEPRGVAGCRNSNGSQISTDEARALEARPQLVRLERRLVRRHVPQPTSGTRCRSAHTCGFAMFGSLNAKRPPGCSSENVSRERRVQVDVVEHADADDRVELALRAPRPSRRSRRRPRRTVADARAASAAVLAQLDGDELAAGLDQPLGELTGSAAELEAAHARREPRCSSAELGAPRGARCAGRARPAPDVLLADAIASPWRRSASYRGRRSPGLRHAGTCTISATSPSRCGRWCTVGQTAGEHDRVSVDREVG